MSLRRTLYEKPTLAVVTPQGFPIDTDPQWSDNLKPWESPNFLTREWIGKFSAAVQDAIQRSRGSVKLNDVGTNTIGEFIYNLTGADGITVFIPAKHLAAIYNQNPGKWPAVAAELDSKLGIS